MEPPPTVSVADAAAATGFTRQAIYRAVRDGRLARFLVRDRAGHARLMVEALAAIRSGVLRLRADSGAGREPVAPSPAAAPPATVWAPWANALIDPELLSSPPWDSTLWWSLSIAIDEAIELAAEHGPLTPEALARWEKELGDE